MCGRVRLADDYSEIKIVLKFDSEAPAPNFRKSWNMPPTVPMLCATYTTDGKRISQMMRWRKSDKQSFAVDMIDDGLMVMAGLYEDGLRRWARRFEAAPSSQPKPMT